jgi:hypothetical protein
LHVGTKFGPNAADQVITDRSTGCHTDPQRRKVTLWPLRLAHLGNEDGWYAVMHRDLVPFDQLQRGRRLKLLLQNQ